MFKISKFIILTFCTSLIGYSQTVNYAELVNPFIGTGGTGHTFPGATMPFGMVQLSPDTRIDGSWEGCSGYHYSDSIIYGFSHTHLSGTGVSDYGDILLMPTIGDPSLNNKDYASEFSHKNEFAHAGYYNVLLNNGHINVELTTTERVGVHRYTYTKVNKGNLVLDLMHRDELLNGEIKVVDSLTIVGKRISKAWAEEQHVYFVIKFNKPFYKHAVKVVTEAATLPQTKINEISESGYFQFNLEKDSVVMVKVGISQTSVEGAIKNLEAEAPHWNFETYKSNAENAWKKQLSKIEIKTIDTSKSTVFYTALYHTMIHPSLAGDVDGNYRGRDNKVHQAKGFVPYTIFSLWDTFRALHPLFTIIEQKRTADFVNSFMDQYRLSKRLPMWELSSNETNCMIGFHSVSVITDAYLKKIRGIDTLGIYSAMKSASNYSNLGIPTFNENNYLQIDDESESVSKTLEYSYDNWCIAQMAKKLNKQKDFVLYSQRAQGFKNVFDKSTGFMRPRKNGNWLSPFNPTEINNHYTEGNSWQYSFFVPQDLNWLITSMGGDKKFEKQLDVLFNTKEKTSGREQADVTGLIGQYAHGNEPSHHMAYLYNYVGKSFKTQQKTYKILNEFYKNSPDGLIGNEDCGQMSAWYVMSAMGIYQVCPGKPEYTFTAPLFDQVIVNLENGKKVVIKKVNSNQSLQSIKYVMLNKKKSLKNSISHQLISNGCKLDFVMSTKVDSLTSFGKQKANRPFTSITNNLIIPAPIIESPNFSFDSIATISMYGFSNKSKIVYLINDASNSSVYKKYTNPITINKSTTLKAKVIEGAKSSSYANAFVHKKPNNWSVTLNCSFNKQYTAGGKNGLIDGVFGNEKWRSGEWQGYQSQDFECIIDLMELKEFEFVSSSYLQDSRSWILFPTQVEVFVSEDGITYKEFSKIKNSILPEDQNVAVRFFGNTAPIKTKARYVKVKAINFGKLPNWHQGRGGDAFIFIDEIQLR